MWYNDFVAVKPYVSKNIREFFMDSMLFYTGGKGIGFIKRGSGSQIEIARLRAADDATHRVIGLA